MITDLREDEQAEVVATFEGEPPFAWSYVLTEAEFDAKHHPKHRKPESKGHNTYENILEHKMSFFTNAEGKSKKKKKSRKSFLSLSIDKNRAPEEGKKVTFFVNICTFFLCMHYRNDRTNVYQR